MYSLSHAVSTVPADLCRHSIRVPISSKLCSTTDAHLALFFECHFDDLIPIEYREYSVDGQG